jgi:predicted PurR-regulated permease PerM
VGQQLVQQTAKGAEAIAAKASAGEWRRALATRPRLAAAAEWLEQRVDLPGSAKSFAAWLSAWAGRLLKGSVFQLIGFCLTFYLLFFFLRDRHLVLRSVRALTPLSEAELDTLFVRINDTIHATICGALAVSSVQGLLGGLMFWWLGLSAPLLWGVVMALLAVVPMLGAFLVWIPAALVLALEGSWGKALVLTLWGMLVVGTIDNLLRPILVGKRLRLHTVLAFISVVGGLLLFGPAGLILGPVTLTVTVVLLDVWHKRTVPPVVPDDAEALGRFETEGGSLARPTAPQP